MSGGGADTLVPTAIRTTMLFVSCPSLTSLCSTNGNPPVCETLSGMAAWRLLQPITEAGNAEQEHAEEARRVSGTLKFPQSAWRGSAVSWEIPRFKTGEVDAAGRILAGEAEAPASIQSALAIVDNWRAGHAFPLNTIQMRLRSSAAAVYENALVAQRLKRLSSIEFKLRRFPEMRLSRMQDIGGCRAILRTPGEVRRLVSDWRTCRIKHRLVSEKDYILAPKSSGYRGVHLVYRYYSDKMETYNGLRIEIQIRSLPQHEWATAVETVGIFLEHSLKSSLGPDDWLRFFALAASAFARSERAPLVPGTPTARRTLVREIAHLKRELQVEQRLKSFGQALRVTEKEVRGDAHYFLMALRPQALNIRSYRRNELDVATQEYLRVEREIEGVPGAQAVLVAAESLKALRRAYPNYYLDTQRFLLRLGVATR